MKSHLSPDEECVHQHFKCISWSAILVGSLMAIGLSFLLNLFAMSIGLSAIRTNSAGATDLAMGGIMGLAIIGIVAMITAGYAAGYLGRSYCPQRNLGIIYGFTTWSVALLLGAAVMTHVSQLAANYSQTIFGSAVVITPLANAAQTPKIVTKSAHVEEDMPPVIATTKEVSCGVFIVFVLFFLGAISTCVGSCWAMCDKRDD